MRKKILPFDQLQLPLLPHPQNNLYEQMKSNPAFTKRNIQNANAYLLKFCRNENSLVKYNTPTKLVHMCLAFQHSHFSADWLSDDLYVSSNWYLRTQTKEKEFNHSIQQTFVGQERLTNPWEGRCGRLSVCSNEVWLYLIQLFNSVSQNKKKLRYIKLHIQPS